MINIKILTSTLILSFCSLKSGFAAQYDSEYIENLAKSFVEENLPNTESLKREISVAKLDPRIVIKPCQLPLTANIPEKRSSRNVNVKISCSDSKPWQLYLPVRVKTLVKVLMTTMPINKGSILDSSNTAVIYQAEHKLRGEYIGQSDGIWGAKAKRNIAKGRAVTKRNICIVCKGESVVLVAQSESFSIKTAGKAMTNGGLGDEVRVKNIQSGRTVTGEVKAINKVVITL